ncbi:cytochrome c oxidase subunit 2A [Deinococcus aquaedulcis]|uniref:cytochrome c oxidase subunit 2A n=1 Tax=Deinococcus aquaedulcis TaxID=2840455 RepID=UPI001C83975B|nr:cytochrome c oxidase subunit 2A [Deinococcus aquaedulcis]
MSRPPHEPHPHEAPPERTSPPRGTLMVIAVLLLSISTLWLLVLGIFQGRA